MRFATCVLGLLAAASQVACRPHSEPIWPVVCSASTDGFAVYVPHPTDCSLFFECVGDEPVLMACPEPLFFDPRLNVCNWPNQVDCIVHEAETTTVEEETTTEEAAQGTTTEAVVEETTTEEDVVEKTTEVVVEETTTEEDVVETTTEKIVEETTTEEAAEETTASEVVNTTAEPTEPISLFATCDNVMELYADGQLVATNSDWRVTSRVDLTQRPKVLAIHCVDLGVVGGILVSGPDGLRSDSTWRCAANPADDWNQVEFDDSEWTAAYEIGANGKAPWGTRPDIDADATWIWSRKTTWQGTDRRVYCRKTL